MNEVINELLHSYKINIKANKEVEDLSSITDNGVINASDLEDFYFNRPKDTATCEGYEASWEHQKEWLHTIENPIYFRL